MTGHRARVRLRLAPAEGKRVPPPVVGNRSLVYRFTSLDSDVAEDLNFGAVMEAVFEAGPDSAEVDLWFWADLAAIHATPQTNFVVWYGEVVGDGEVIDSTAVMVEERLIHFDLTASERRLLRAGIGDWGGPSRCTDAMAQAMGFASVEALFDDGRRIIERLRYNEPLSHRDWARALLATEVCFASSLGSTIDWEVTTGFRDDETIALIRSLQRKLSAVTNALRRGDFA